MWPDSDEVKLFPRDLARSPTRGVATAQLRHQNRHGQAQERRSRHITYKHMRFNSVVSHINRQVFSIYRSSLQFTISIQTNNEQCKPNSKMLNVLTTQVGHCTLHFFRPQHSSARSPPMHLQTGRCGKLSTSESSTNTAYRPITTFPQTNSGSLHHQCPIQ